jgi:hypothetical protein
MSLDPLIKTIVTSLSANPRATDQFGKFERLSASPSTIRAYLYLNYSIDVSSILPMVRVPTLVLHRAADLQVPVELGKELAASIPGAKYIEYPGGDHAFWSGDPEPLLATLRNLSLDIARALPTRLERVLATVLFHRHRRFDPPRGGTARPEMAAATRRSRSVGATDDRTVSWDRGQDHRGRRAGDFRWVRRPCGAPWPIGPI